MSERFMVDDAGALIDMQTRDMFDIVEEVVDLLNTLNDENEQLKQSYKEFEDECQSTFNAMSRKQDDLYRKNFKLKEENEQLKSENNMLKVTIGRNESYIATLTHKGEWHC